MVALLNFLASDEFELAEFVKLLPMFDSKMSEPAS